MNFTIEAIDIFAKWYSDSGSQVFKENSNFRYICIPHILNIHCI